MPDEEIQLRSVQIRSRRAVVITHEGRQYLSLESLCRPWGLSTFSMWKIIQAKVGLRHFSKELEDPIAGTPLLCLDVEAVDAWITDIPEENVPAPVREEHKEWCIETVKMIRSYRTTGLAVSEKIYGAEGKRDIEQFAFARIDHLRACESCVKTAAELMSDDPVALSYARIACKNALMMEANIGSNGPSIPENATIRTIGLLHGFIMSADAVYRYLGSPVAKEYKRRYGASPSNTTQLGLPPEEGAHSTVAVPANAYHKRDWPWVIEIIEKQMQKHGDKLGKRVRLAA